MIRPLVNLLFPLICPLCERPLGDDDPHRLCHGCWRQLNDGAFLTSLDPVPFVNRLWACGPYDGSLKELIHRFKFKGQRSLAIPLSELLLAFATTHRLTEGIDVVVPVPLHPVRQRERGFNQSLLLSQRCAQPFRRPLLPRALLRTKPTASQTQLPRAERLTNVRGAFRCPRPRQVEEQRILLIDDVLTTGATVSECARTLKEAGATKVTACTLARGI